ncbi:uncharacterized protein A4U43_C07F18350 [Asparagus officinalis]|uniref:CCHC-type domain-containing protein n=1 Tax=Asparagus officinalis TaxID=4686 RepID=A0A5P1ED90_ASPOF|nr:uncharacterized protein A4U43_C07F18350 [Asparagus officinalis]
MRHIGGMTVVRQDGLICARTARDLDIMLGNVPMWLSATIVDFQGTLQWSAAPRPSAGTAKSQAMWPVHALTRASATPVERRDTKCYKPGHLAIDCTNDKACNNCRKSGHLARDCPNDPVCNLCNISGHVARQCPKADVLGERGGRDDGPWPEVLRMMMRGVIM